LIFGLSVLTALIVFSAVGTRIVDGVPLAAIVLLQSFRIAVEWLLHRLYLEGSVPLQMTWSGRNLDVISGITGLLLGLALLRGVRVPRAVVLGWNVLGLALLANIVIGALLAAPALHHFVGGPPNLLPSTFPWVWLPSF